MKVGHLAASVAGSLSMSLIRLRLPLLLFLGLWNYAAHVCGAIGVSADDGFDVVLAFVVSAAVLSFVLVGFMPCRFDL